MNSKELLEQAEQRIAEVEAIRLAKRNIEDLERLIKISQDDTYDVRYCGEFDLPLEQSLDVDNYSEVRLILEATFRGYLNVQVIKLEQLLGVTPKIINPDFEAAIRTMEQAAGRILEGEPSGIPEPEVKVLIKEPAVVMVEKIAGDSEAAYPAKKTARKYPSEMTVEAVSRMYLDEHQTMMQIAGHFGVQQHNVNDFLNRHNLRRNKRTKRPQPEPAETERP